MEQVLIAVAAITAILAGSYWYLFRWERARKSWCVILYHVSRDTNALFKWPDEAGVPQQNALDVKLDQVIETIEGLPAGSLLTAVKTALMGLSSSPRGVNWEDVHIVYRAVWNGHPIRPPKKPVMRARVVSWRPGAPSYPDDVSFADPAAVPPSDDQDGFFKWVYDRCPADRYAVFFWGHSLGPGGLFELNNSPEFPPVPTPSGPVMPANLSSLGETLQTFFDLRRQGQSPAEDASLLRTAALGGGATPAGSGSATTGSTSGTTAVIQPKVEVVLFQDCWMSTVETAFELKDVARYVVASQSLVPIGYQFDANGVYVDPRGPVWPYEALIATLLAQPSQFADPLFQELKTFFDAHEVNRRPTPIVTFALLDLGEDIGAGNDIETTLKPRLKTLIRELAPLTEAERKYLMKRASIVKFKNDNPNRDLQGGEWALADVMRLCGILTTPASYDAFNPPNESQLIAAAHDVAHAVQRPASSSSYAVVRQVFESPAGGVPLGFSGLSVLWIPGPSSQMPAGDPYIAGQIDGTFYRTLEFVTATAVTASPTTRWSDYAFEQTA